jgi:hypothetical protein
MWVKREEYIQLRANVAAQSQTIELLRVMLNEARERIAYLEGDKLGIPPVRVPVIERVDPAATKPARIHATPKVAGRVPEAPTMQDVLSGNLSFEDMGDDEARRQGVDWDPATGTVAYR